MPLTEGVAVSCGGASVVAVDSARSFTGDAVACTSDPYRPVLRGMLLTGVENHYLRSTVGGVGLASDRLMWWPPSKIAGKYLAPYLAGESGETLMDLPTHENRIPIDVELDRSETFG